MSGASNLPAVNCFFDYKDDFKQGIEYKHHVTRLSHNKEYW